MLRCKLCLNKEKQSSKRDTSYLKLCVCERVDVVKCNKLRFNCLNLQTVNQNIFVFAESDIIKGSILEKQTNNSTCTKESFSLEQNKECIIDVPKCSNFRPADYGLSILNPNAEELILKTYIRNFSNIKCIVLLLCTVNLFAY